jgi:hypothetical protein
MIVIPMLGRSSRFFDAGYKLPKFQLPLGGETVFTKSVRSFEQQFESEHFLFIVRHDYDTKEFVRRELTNLGIMDFRILELNFETRGQAHSVDLGCADYADQLPITVFNIDTIRLGFNFPETLERGDGFLEVFQSEGENWSFVEAGDKNRVIRTTEKVRISNLCSNGLYNFARLGDFRDAFKTATEELQAGEIYIAPLYNDLIAKGLDIRYRLVEPSKILHCGLPADYEALKTRLSK